MRESVNDFAKRGLALLVLLFAAFIVFKIVVGVAAGIFWTVLVIAVLIAAIWAFAQLR